MDSDYSPAGMHVLVVDDDPLCLVVLERMLRRCQYRVTTCNRVASALRLLRENINDYDLVMSDVYMPDEDGFKLLETIGLELDLPVIMMSANGETSVVMKGITHGACDYLIKPIRMEELNTIWQHVVRRSKGNDNNSPESELKNEDIEFQDCNSKRRKEQAEDWDESVDSITNVKKARVNWSAPLHQKFVMAVNELGIDQAAPKKILDKMDVAGLTREQVSSHLQKYRLYLKRLSGVTPDPIPIASFQPAGNGDTGGAMRVEAGKKTAAPMATNPVKQPNFGSGISPKGGPIARGMDSGTLAEMRSLKLAANRAQVLGGLGLRSGSSAQSQGGDEGGSGGLRRGGPLGGVLGGDPGGLFRMGSLDIGLLLKLQQEEDQQRSANAMDDLAAAFSSTDAFKGETKKANRPRAPRPLIPTSSLSSSCSSSSPSSSSYVSSSSEELPRCPRDMQ